MLGLFPYDLRMRLNGPLPVIVAQIPEQSAASELMATLRGWGHGAVGCALSTVPSASEMFTPREFEFDEGVLVLRGAGRELSVRPGQVYALIHTMALTETRTTRETTSKTFSAARAVATGGMVMRKKQTKTATSTESQSGEQVYLVPQSKAAPVLLAQHALRYSGLGEDMSRSSLTSFATSWSACGPSRPTPSTTGASSSPGASPASSGPRARRSARPRRWRSPTRTPAASTSPRACCSSPTRAGSCELFGHRDVDHAREQLAPGAEMYKTTVKLALDADHDGQMTRPRQSAGDVPYN